VLAARVGVLEAHDLVPADRLLEPRDRAGVRDVLQFPWPFMTLIVAPATDASGAVAAIRQETARLDAAQAAGAVCVLDEMRMEWLDQPRLRTAVVTLFGVATLLLTLAGLYARIVHSVKVRSKELAIRQALGARPTDVVRQLTAEAIAIIAVGLIAGIALLPPSSRLLSALIADTAPIDLSLAAGVTSLLAVSALASTYWPARRAGRINLIDLMRSV
jgi:putative ABC transport system permease protein